MWVNEGKQPEQPQNRGSNAKSKFISLPLSPENPKAAPEWRHTSGNAGTVELSPSQLLAPIYQGQVVFHHAVTSLLCFMISGLWSPLSWNRELRHVCEGASEHLQTPSLGLQRDSASQSSQSMNSNQHNGWAFPHCFSPGLGIPSCKVTQQTTINIGPVLPFSSQHQAWLPSQGFHWKHKYF